MICGNIVKLKHAGDSLFVPSLDLLLKENTIHTDMTVATTVKKNATAQCVQLNELIRVYHYSV